jgi:NAD(P)-dependent dehydrogenase (short-subunit alcohol dehydrogenase family)
MLITGCSTGFGRALALHMARRGWRVFATVRKEADREGLLAEAAAQGAAHGLRAVLADITRAADVDALRQAVAAEVSQLQSLVNNAGTSYPAPLELLPIDELRAQLELNVVAHLAVTQALLPLLKAGRGTLVNVSSVGGRAVLPCNGAYSMSKFALEAMSDALRVELAPFGVQVVVVEPGASPTAIWDTSIARGLGPGRSRPMGSYAPLVETILRNARRSAAAGFPPDLFARLVEHIVTRPRPRPRYVIPGRVALIIWLRKLLPDRLWDWSLRRILRW